MIPAAVQLMIAAAPFATPPPPPPPPPVVVQAAPAPATAPTPAATPVVASPAQTTPPPAPPNAVVLQVQSCIVHWTDTIDPTKTDGLEGPCQMVQAFATANGIGPVVQVTNSVVTDTGTLAGT